MVLSLSSFEEVHEVAKDFDGWLDITEAQLLYDTASKLKNEGAIVEIGSWCAKSLTYMTLGALANGFNKKIYSIDPFLTSKDEPNGMYETFISNLKRNNIYEKITQIKEKSQIAGKTFNDKIELIFIDGFHKYEAVKQDVELFFPKIVLNGYIAIHDVFGYQGPTDVVIELAQRDDYKIIGICASTVIAQKVAKLDEEARASNKKFVEQIRSIIINANLIK